ncbi:MAG: ATP synthase subunit AtpR [Granulosicoccus sp.]|nr:ATP synthase subunit AtpR [Granulosicoccus sp.]
MITAVDWTMVGFGLLAGAVASTLFFAGLAAGMKIALNSTSTTTILVLSALIRILLLLGAGSSVATLGPAATIGFAVAFLLTRYIIMAVVRPGTSRGPG